VNAKRTTRKVAKTGRGTTKTRGIVSMTLDEARAHSASGKGRTDWARVDALTDGDIAKAVAADPDAPPLLDDTFWRNAKLLVQAANASKSTITIRVDADVLADLKRLGPGYQSRINAVLRAYVNSARKAG
jgi:uncharacterized protein (DUF4415 family)